MKIKRFRPPLKTIFFIGGDDMRNFEELEEEMNNLSDNDQEPHLMRQDYERYLGTK